MNRSRVIWGTICLVLAGILAALNLTLQSDSLMFMIGDTNMPWIPPIVLGAVGIFLLGTGLTSSTKESEEKLIEKQPEPLIDEERAALNKRLESVAWGLFLIMLGGSILIPNEQVPNGIWSIGLGLIMLGLNATRYFYGLRMSGFTTVLGILALLGGIAELFGFTSLEGGMLLIILGAYLILKPWFDKHQIFGKAEHA